MSNINPNIKPYKKLQPFKFFALTNFPFIDADFDAMTNYELLCKIVEYLNNIVSDTNIANENVQELYNAFMSLQTDVQAQIEQGFSALNVQNEVNNKLDQMASSGELNEIILNAINELNPEILDESKRINVIDFDNAFIDVIAPYNLLPNNVLNNINKQYLIQIVEYLIKNNSTKYYFINPYDAQRVIYYTLDIENYETTGKIYLSAKMYMPALNLSYGNRYFDRAEFSITYENETVTNIEFVSQNTHAYNILRTNNINEYIPTNLYAPATKKYVDDNAGGSSDQPIYFLEFTDYGTTLGCSQYAGVSFADTDWDKLKTALNDAHSKNYSDILLVIKLATNNNYNLFECHIDPFDSTSNNTIITMIQELNSANYQNIIMYGSNNDGLNYISLNFVVSVTNGLIDSFLYQTSSPIGNRTFPVAENVLPRDLSNSITLNGDFQAYGVEGVKLIKQGNMFNLHGTILSPNGSNWSSAKIDLNADCAPIPFESGVGYTACYTTCVLIKASDSSIHYLYSNYAHVADAELGSITFTPVDSTLTIDANDVIRFNISYIRLPQ